MWIVIVWWLWMQVLGLAALPLAARFFRRLPDRGYAFARPLGLLLTSYVLWLGSSLGLLRNSLGGVLASLVVVALGSWLVYRRGRAAGEPGIWGWLRANWRLVVTVEVLFGGALVLWSLVRAYSPDLTTSGGEKFMEIMYLNSIGRSELFPPQDAWLGGYAISYYYFGYVMMAMLTRLSGWAAHLTFHVGVASLFALTCTGAFGLVYNLVKHRHDVRAVSSPGRDRAIAHGLLGAALVAVMGNLEGFLEVLYSARLLPEAFWRWLDILDINGPFDAALAPSLMPARDGWWWWRASRVIHDLDPLGQTMGIQPIDEFPGFSFLLGDMHPHVLALPFVLLAVAVALRALLAGSGDTGGVPAPAGRYAGWIAPARRVPLLVPLCLGALGFLNTWDFPIYWLLFVAAYALGRWRPGRRWDRDLARDVVVTGLSAAVLGFLLYLPFYLGFQSQAGGVLPALYVGTRFRHYFVMFGPFLAALAGLLAVLLLRLARRETARRWAGSWARWLALFLLLPLGTMFLGTLLVLVTPWGQGLLDEVRSNPAVYAVVGDAPWHSVLGQLLLVKLRTWVMPLLVAAMAALGVVLLDRSLPVRDPARETEGGPGAGMADVQPDASLRFVLVCAVVGLLLTLSVEFVYLVDIFRVRMNTIFKFYFQAWVLLAVASAYAVSWLSDSGNGARWLRRAALAAFWVLFAAGMVYPVLGNTSRAGGFDGVPTLDGTAYLSETQPDDYAAITWLNRHVEGAPVILEAPATGGDSYVYEGRVSALTGLPTLLGWAGHELQWRGSYTLQNAREPDIQTIYNTPDPEAARSLLTEYGVRYVYVGPLERSKYDPRGLLKFERFMDVAYRNEGVTIYEMRD